MNNDSCLMMEINKHLQLLELKMHTDIPLAWYLSMMGIVFLGIPTNILTIIVVFSQKRNHSVRILILMLTISDIVNIIYYILFSFMYTKSFNFITNNYTCKIYHISLKTMIYNSHLLVLMIALNRWITLKWPYKQLSSNNSIKLVICTFFMSLLLGSKEGYEYFYSQVSNSTEWNCVLQYQLYQVNDTQQIINTILEYALKVIILGIPVIVFIINILSVIKIYQIQTERNKVIHNDDFKPVAFILVSFYFILTTVPKEIFPFIYPQPESGPPCLETAEIQQNYQWKQVIIWQYLFLIFQYLFYSYYSIKFFIYVWISKWFRVAFIAKFRWIIDSSVKCFKSTNESAINASSLGSSLSMSYQSKSWKTYSLDTLFADSESSNVIDTQNKPRVIKTPKSATHKNIRKPTKSTSKHDQKHSSYSIKIRETSAYSL